MGRTATERVALMSIHPVYAEAIFQGTKTVEFRKRRLADDIKTVVVYATAPVSRVLGTFDIDEIVEDSPEAIWSRYGDHGVIGQTAFFDYYEGKEVAVAIVVEEVTSFDEPLALSEVEPNSTAPQSFAYLQRDQLLVNA